MEDKNITIYSSPNCHHCNDLKEFLSENNIEYTDYDVTENEEKREELLQKSEQMGVPVVFIGDEMVIGFDKKKISELLGLQ